jgi:hypothetical protein
MFMHFSGLVRKEGTMFRLLQHKGHNAIIFPIIKQRIPSQPMNYTTTGMNITIPMKYNV